MAARKKPVDPDDTNAGSSYPAKHRASRLPKIEDVGKRIPIPKPDSHVGDDRGTRKAGHRPGPKHERQAPPRKRTPKAAPTSPAPTSSAPSSGAAPAAGDRTATMRSPSLRRASARADRIGEEARYLGQQAAIRATTGRPTVTGRAAAGAASGAAVGTAVGGPVGTAVGSGVGAVVGGVSGAAAKKAYNASMRAYPYARKALVAEFAACALIVALSPMRDKDAKPGDWMRRMTAVMGLFFILGLVSQAGRYGARAAAAFGGLVTLAVVISERDLFRVAAKAVQARESFGAADPEEIGDVGHAEKSGGIDDMRGA